MAMLILLTFNIRSKKVGFAKNKPLKSWEVKMCNCEKCGCELKEKNDIFEFFTNNATECQELCFDCANELANQHSADGIEYEINRNCEEWKLCTWCEEIYPMSELRKEADMGYLCDHCIQAIWSRGEKLSIEY
jgi:hypothetical protein